MKTLTLFAIAIFITLSSVSSAQTQPTPKSISDIENIEATPIGYTLVVTGEKIDFVRFHEFYSEVYAEIYDEKGELVDVIVGDQIYVYTTKTYKAYPVYENSSPHTPFTPSK